MFTKKLLFSCVVVAMLLMVFSGTPLAIDDDNRSCDPAGMWFGFPLGNPPFKVVSFIPLDGGKRRYIMAAEDGDPGVTPFRGEMVRIKKNLYKGWGMQYLLIAPGDFDYYVISGEWNMTDCNTAEGNWLLSYYEEDPFHDSAIPLWSFPMVNYYDRMPMIDDASGF